MRTLFLVVCATIAVILLMEFGGNLKQQPVYAAVTGNCLYTVQYGDWLSTIAMKHGFGTNWTSLYEQNRAVIGSNPNIIYPGMHLNVCGAPGSATAHVAYAPAHQSIPNPAIASSTGNIRTDIMNVFGPVYGPGAIRVAICESGLIPWADNHTEPVILNGQKEWAQGLFQFIPTTWAMTPYASQDVHNAYANTLAAHWLFARDGYSWSVDWPDTAHCAYG